MLESVLKRNPDHPGANHFYIHATEASKSPERALPSARRLETLVPAAGHLVHMPAHVYVRTGDYVAAEKSNTVAAEVDRAYIRETGAQGMYPVMYYNHNVHFESYAASMAGRYAAAKRSGDRLFDEVASGRLDGPDARGLPSPAGVRRGALPEVGRRPEDAGPGAEAAAPEGGMALGARDGRRGLRETSRRRRSTLREAFVIALEPPFPKRAWPVRRTPPRPCSRWRPTFSTPASPKRRATRRPRSRAGERPSRPRIVWPTTSRPPGTTRRANRSARRSCRAGQAAEAEAVFRADLEQHPRNGRSLYGLSKSLEAQKKNVDAAFARAQFDTAWKDADTPVRLEDL